MSAHERNAGGGAIVRHVDDELYIMERPGRGALPGLVFVLNNRGDRWNGAHVDTTRPNVAFRPVAWSGRDAGVPDATATSHDGRGQFWAPPLGYTVYAPA